MTPPRPKPDGSRVTQVRILPPPQEASSPFDVPDWTPAIRALVFGATNLVKTPEPVKASGNNTKPFDEGKLASKARA